MMHNIKCFRSYNSDGWETQYLCNGIKHLEKFCGEGHDPSHFRVIGPCDQMCTPAARAVDVRKLYSTALATILPVSDETEYPNHVSLDDATAALLAAPGEVIGTEFRSFYAKRSESGRTVCLGSQHLWISEQWNWCSRDVGDGCYTTHAFSLSSPVTVLANQTV